MVPVVPGLAPEEAVVEGGPAGGAEPAEEEAGGREVEASLLFSVADDAEGCEDSINRAAATAAAARALKAAPPPPPLLANIRKEREGEKDTGREDGD